MFAKVHRKMDYFAQSKIFEDHLKLLESRTGESKRRNTTATGGSDVTITTTKSLDAGDIQSKAVAASAAAAKRSSCPNVAVTISELVGQTWPYLHLNGRRLYLRNSLKTSLFIKMAVNVLNLRLNEKYQ